MIKILSSKESKQLDKYTIDNNPRTGSKLIDSAGKTLAFHILDKVNKPFNKSFLCIAGLGNNGLDAIVCNYYLLLNNINSSLLLLNTITDKKKYSKYLPKKIINFNNVNFDKYDWIVEGIFGIGLNREIENNYYNTIKALATKKNIISIDISSGIYASTGASTNISIQSKETITFGYPKLGHFLSDGYENTGKLFIYDIGHKTHKKVTNINILEENDIIRILSPVKINSNKYSKGKIVSISGSTSYTGAGILNTSASLSAGCGIVKHIYESSLLPAMSNNLEIIDIPLKGKKGNLDLINYEDIKTHIDWSTCLVIGPGVLDNKSTINLSKKILYNLSKRTIIDAGALSTIDNYSNSQFSELPKYSILTPHYGELARILNISINELRNNTISILQKVSRYLDDRVLILKGPNTIIINGSGEIYFVTNGNYLLSTAGTGDVLTGIISSYLANADISLINAAILGCYIHGICSEILKNEGYQNIKASQLINCIPIAQNKLQVLKDEK